MNHVFIDVEAFRLKQPWRAPLCNVAAVLFNEVGQVKATTNLFIESSSWPTWVEPEQSTIDWWKGVPVYKDLMDAMVTQGLPYDRVIKTLADTIELWGPEGVWFAGPTYDQVMLEAYFDNLGIPIPWKYNASRDFRTVRKQYPEILEGLPHPEGKHLALTDCLFDVGRLRMISEVTGREWK